MDNRHRKGRSFSTVLESTVSRRQVVKAGLTALVATPLSSLAETKLSPVVSSALLGFNSVAVSDLIDEVVVPRGYSAEVFYRWGDPVSDGPSFKMDGSNTAQEQLQQAGMHHDAIQFYPITTDSSLDERGLLVMNHEYIDPQILHIGGGVFDQPQQFSAEKVLKEQYAHGISVIEIKKYNAQWQIVRPSSLARRITATTAMTIAGPVAGSDYIKTEADPDGKVILGTFNNCSNGKMPWGTYLSCEENINGYFKLSNPEIKSDKQQLAWQRYSFGNSYYGWHHHDPRFNLDLHPNEANRFGWVIEFDPFNPTSQPVKRTALGRFFHENVAHKLANDKRVALYSGDDSQFEYVYKFISAKSWDGTQGAHHGQLLDEGVLYVARFDDDGTGHWLPLVFGLAGLTEEDGFDNQADVLVHARLAADAVGATPMDRPEWITVHPETGAIFVSMTNNSKRGKEGKPAKDAANPRDQNQFGHIVQLDEQDASDLQFNWQIFTLAGAEQDKQSTIFGDGYANPDGLMIDDRGVLWVQTDISASKLNTGEFEVFGNNQMLAVDPVTGESRRFLTGPVGCEVTGVVMTPDLTTMWVNIQHPGDVPAKLKQQGVIKTPDYPNAASNWPDKADNGRPRSATVMITKDDGGIIGS